MHVFGPVGVNVARYVTECCLVQEGWIGVKGSIIAIIGVVIGELCQGRTVKIPFTSFPGLDKSDSLFKAFTDTVQLLRNPSQTVFNKYHKRSRLKVSNLVKEWINGISEGTLESFLPIFTLPVSHPHQKSLHPSSLPHLPLENRIQTPTIQIDQVIPSESSLLSPHEAQVLGLGIRVHTTEKKSSRQEQEHQHHSQVQENADVEMDTSNGHVAQVPIHTEDSDSMSTLPSAQPGSSNSADLIMKAKNQNHSRMMSIEGDAVMTEATSILSRSVPNAPATATALPVTNVSISISSSLNMNKSLPVPNQVNVVNSNTGKTTTANTGKDTTASGGGGGGGGGMTWLPPLRGYYTQSLSQSQSQSQLRPNQVPNGGFNVVDTADSAASTYQRGQQWLARNESKLPYTGSETHFNSNHFMTGNWDKDAPIHRSNQGWYYMSGPGLVPPRPQRHDMYPSLYPHPQFKQPQYYRNTTHYYPHTHTRPHHSSNPSPHVASQESNRLPKLPTSSNEGYNHYHHPRQTSCTHVHINPHSHAHVQYHHPNLPPPPRSNLHPSYFSSHSANHPQANQPHQHPHGHAHGHGYSYSHIRANSSSMDLDPPKRNIAISTGHTHHHQTHIHIPNTAGPGVTLSRGRSARTETPYIDQLEAMLSRC
ncbi:hypothetical protein BKA69DRAFT_779922 [Paraphysoderma sedebokerense]|nr:hypothetical protein BKA69DRAFT_779922 [Paraphysoderma sedebokerense]